MPKPFSLISNVPAAGSDKSLMPVMIILSPSGSKSFPKTSNVVNVWLFTSNVLSFATGLLFPPSATTFKVTVAVSVKPFSSVIV